MAANDVAEAGITRVVIGWISSCDLDLSLLLWSVFREVQNIQFI